MMKLMIYLYMWMLLMMILINMFPTYNNSMHPILMNLILLIMLIFMTLNISMFNITNWMSYIIFLIMIGGMMIIFMYFTSFTNNMKMSISMTNLFMIPLKLTVFMMFFLIMLMNMKFFSLWMIPNIETNKLIYSFNLNLTNSIMLMYISNKNLPMIFSLFYLLINLSFIVKIIINKKITLRKIN